MGAGLAYLISPIDLIPGFIPVLGQLDDIIVALAVLIKILKELPSSERNAYLDKFTITLEMIETDLKAAKEMTHGLAKNALSATSTILTTGIKAPLKLAFKGAMIATKKIVVNKRD